MSGYAASRTGVLFVCLGNICRSPLARAVFTDLVIRRDAAHLFDIDSCGTGAWHVGHGADPRTIAVAQRHGLTLSHTARQLNRARDFARFGLIIAMDRQNLATLLDEGASPAQVRLMRSFDAAAKGDVDVPDPYYGEGDGFETVYQMLVAASEGLYEDLTRARP